MILSIYAFVGFVAILLVLGSKSHRTMNIFSALHALTYVALASYALLYASLPTYFLENRYFFMDHFGLYEVLIGATLFFFASMCARGYLEGSIKMGELSPENVKLFYAAFNFLLIVVTYAFFSNNLALFWIFAELSTVFSAVLVVTLNAKKNIGAALKYVFMASTSMIFSFIGLIFIYTLTSHALGFGTLNWDVLMMNAKGLSPTILLASFTFVFIGFAAKSGVVPFHGWLPTAHSKAPAPVSAVLSGVITSIGIYGIIRMFAVLHATSVASRASTVLIAFGLLSMFVAALSMLQQVNLKKFIGFSTIENVGLMLVGIGIGTPIAIFWVLFHTLVHSLTKAMLFFSAGIIHHQYESVRAEKIINMLKLQPLASAGLIIGGTAIIGMPPFAVFLSKFFILSEIARASPVLLFVVLILLLIVIGAFALFMTKLVAQVDETEIEKGHEHETASSNSEHAHLEQYIAPRGIVISIAALIAAIFILGLYFPQALTDLLNVTVGELGF